METDWKIGPGEIGPREIEPKEFRPGQQNQRSRPATSGPVIQTDSLRPALRSAAPLCPAAPLDTVPLILRAVSNQKLFLILEFKDRINLVNLRRAAAALLQLHPILGCHVVSGRKWPRWQQSARPHIRVCLHHCTAQHSPGPLVGEIAGDIAGAAGRKICEKIAQRSPYGDETVAIDVLRHEQSDTVIITVDHTIADAAGTREIAYALAALYAHPDSAHGRASAGAIAWPRDLQEIRTAMNWRQKLRRIANWRITRGQWQYPIPACKAPTQPAYIIKQLDSISISALKTAHSGSHATINDMLLSAYFCALCDQHKHTADVRLPLQFTLDLRRYLPPDRQQRIGNYSSAVQVWLQRKHGESFGDVLRHTQAAMHTTKQSHSAVGAGIALEWLAKLGYTRLQQHLGHALRAPYRDGLANPILTNFGILNESRLRFGNSQIKHACIAGPALFAPGIMLAASTYRDKLTLSAGFDAAITAAADVTRLMQQTASYLEAS